MIPAYNYLHIGKEVMERVRWVGFDMDECIGSVMPLFPFVTEVPSNILMELIYTSERKGKTWLIRPAMLSVLERLYEAFETKKITGAFVFSNNDSEPLVEFIANYLNYCMWRMFQVTRVPANVFQMAVCRSTPARRGYGMVKNFAVIQKCLARAGLPECSKDNLMFFDDLEHELQSEIPHYVRVPAYLFQTEINQMLEALEPLSDVVGKRKWKKLSDEARLHNTHDFARPDNTYKPYRQPLDATIRDIRIFDNAFTRFLNKRKQTRKRKMSLRDAAPFFL
jgi:hypothetical protein